MSLSPAAKLLISIAAGVQSTDRRNQPRQLAVDPLSKISKIVLPSRQGPQSLLPQEVPDPFAKGVSQGQAPISRRTGIVGPTSSLRGIVSEARSHGMGGLCQAPLRPARTGSQVFGPVYAPCCHFQPAAVIHAGWSSHLRMEGLCRWQPDQDDDLGSRRVHSPLSPPRSAPRLCPHPAFRLPGQPQTQGKAGAVPVFPVRPASGQPSQPEFSGQPGLHVRGAAPPMSRLQDRKADPHTSSHGSGLCRLIRAHARRHFTTAMSAPSSNLPNSSALARVTGDPCFEPAFWLSSNAGSGRQTRKPTLPSGTVTISATRLSRRHALAPAPLKQTTIQSP